MRQVLLILLVYISANQMYSQESTPSCEILSIKYKMAYIADLELAEFKKEIFENRRCENSWQYVFEKELIKEIVFDSTIGNHKKAKLIYENEKLIEVLFNGGFTSKKTYEYNPKGELIKSKEFSILGDKEKAYEQKSDTLIIKGWNEDLNKESINKIIFNSQYANLTFPYASELYFDELLSVQMYYEDNDYNYEHVKDECGNTIAILKKFKDYNGNKEMIQQIKYFEIEYK